jgi:signal transduction histidine kinase
MTESAQGPERRPLRALILEDSDDDAVLVVRALRHQGYEVTSRRVCAEAAMRAALGEQAWDIVISDYSMPGFTVADALSVLREHDMDVPFILISGSVGEEVAVGAMKAGAHDFFLKDRLARLGSAIERELRESKIRHERRVAAVKLLESERELRRAVQVRDEFLAIASHELRTPLTPLVLQLQGALRTLRAPRGRPDGALGDEIASKIENALRYVERLTLLVVNLLDVARITSGRMELARRRVDLSELVAGVSRRLHETMRAGELRVAAGGPVEGMWDPVAIESVVVNLLSNAIKYGDGKAVDVTVERANDVARLTVADQGIGIEESDQRRIFERFERAVPAKHYGGFGIGLWVTNRVVTEHGGTITVSSAKGVGSTFVVELPLGEAAVAG